MLGVTYGGPEYVALYGSLMSEFPAQEDLGVRDQLERVGPCLMEGQLFSLGDWPGMVVGEGQVTGELFRVLDEKVFAKLDLFEHFDPAKPEGCKYIRRAVRLIEPELDAWTYYYSWALDGAPVIPHGSWSRFVKEG